MIPAHRYRAIPLIALLSLPAVLAAPHLTPTASERFWLAAKFDGAQAMIYLDTVKFGITLPFTPTWLHPAAGLLTPCLLQPSYAARFQNRSGATRFAIGDRYDLLSQGNLIQTATVTKVIGWPNDEAVGNVSYMGVLVTLDNKDMPVLDDYFVARRHTKEDTRTRKDFEAPYAHLVKEPVRFDIQTQIVALMNQRMKASAPETVRSEAEQTSPLLSVQAFTLADSSLRYYVRCGWQLKQPERDPIFVLGAWLVPIPTLHIVGIQEKTSGYGFERDLPELLNVIDLGNGQTGVIVSISGDDGYFTSLLEYRDGAIDKMRELQTLGSAE